MEREIKFRVWDNVDYMSNPFTLFDLQSKKVQFTEDCIVMQFTGLHDKEGNEIYEGDIVKCGDDTLTVTWNKKFASFCLDKNGWMHSHYFGEAADPSQCEVIGNIHLHPELLTNN